MTIAAMSAPDEHKVHLNHSMKAADEHKVHPNKQYKSW